MNDQTEALQKIADFDHVFTVTDADTVEHGPAGVYAPECYHDEKRDIDLAGAESQWEALTGYTGQYSYNGAVMHASEYLGGGLARDILATPGTYVAVSVEVLPEDVCVHCEREIEEVEGEWIDPAAPATPEDGDDHVWRATCDASPLFDASHERDDHPEPAGWAILRMREVERHALTVTERES